MSTPTLAPPPVIVVCVSDAGWWPNVDSPMAELTTGLLLPPVLLLLLLLLL